MTDTDRTFTVAELTALGVPPDSPDDVQYSDHLLADEPVATLKYSQQRRCVFRYNDGQTWAVTYQAPVDAGDYEAGPPPENHGWYGDTVTATAMRQLALLKKRWVPVDEVDDEMPATLRGGHALVVEYGDCELYGRCQCGIGFGAVTPDKTLERFAQRWERHVMTGGDTR